jgi:hypothetical protein
MLTEAIGIRLTITLCGVIVGVAGLLLFGALKRSAVTESK